MLIPGALTSIRSERGFTLIETLVAMITGVIVTGALFAILEVSMHQSSRISDVAQATQLGRTTMTHIVDEMHSACLSQGFKPVLAESSPTKLILINGYSEAAEIPTASSTTSTGVRKDEIIYSETAHTLTDKTSLSTAETSPGAYSWGTAKSVLIGEHITQTEELIEKVLTPVPIFTYYAYAKSAETETTKSSNTLEEIKTKELTKEELTALIAAKVGSVLVRFTAAPTNNNVKLGRAAEFNGQDTFAFSAPDAENPISNGPCE